MLDSVLTCPSGGNFYVCNGKKTEFIGCCTVNPCGDETGGCPIKNIRASSFSPDYFSTLPPQSCSHDSGSSLWYTCNFTTPPFLGCCRENPCNTGCVQANLVQAVLATDPEARAAFLTAISADARTVLPTHSLYPTVSGSSVLPSISVTTTSSSQQSPHTTFPTTAIIVGASLGGVILLVVVAILMFFWGRRRGRTITTTDRTEGFSVLEVPATRSSDQELLSVAFTPGKSGEMDIQSNRDLATVPPMPDRIYELGNDTQVYRPYRVPDAVN
ncbi:hypothetical protein QBC35DRAFT_396411 [Podospora australis]|uniref:Uncharacterized protein n=1 Tax=Podospora australis TaxID=1536484 RepID=A0AAN7ACK1_9PEZI|nr:hypothetical protein QBC35DRAFT_396411 [Podospora australis]